MYMLINNKIVAIYADSHYIAYDIGTLLQHYIRKFIQTSCVMFARIPARGTCCNIKMNCILYVCTLRLHGVSKVFT